VDAKAEQMRREESAAIDWTHFPKEITKKMPLGRVNFSFA